MSRSAKGTAQAPGTNVAAKSGLNRSILDKGWSMFARLPDYKLADRGGELIEVPPEYTSQMCAECGVISRESRKSQSEFVCVGCGQSANADTNAARNILSLGHRRWACGSNRASGRKHELSERASHAA
jgi:putative transposase